MKDIFLISGLGADQRVFEFLDLSGYRLNFIEWIEPQINEPLNLYARRLCSQISSTRPILIGVSFGGIIANEIGKLVDTEQIILISSVKARKDLPLYFKLAGVLRLDRIMPISLLKMSGVIAHWFFGTQSKSDSDLVDSMIRETDDKFLGWAISKILNWNNDTIIKNTFLIQGTADRLFPLKHAEFIIEGGGHFMIVNRADRVSKAIRNILNE